MTNLHHVSLAFIFLPLVTQGAETISLTSPNQSVRATVSIRNNELVYQLQVGGKTVLEESRLGVTVDGADLGSGVKDLNAGEITEHKEQYRLNGDESLLNGHDANGISVSINTVPSPDAVIVTIPAADASNGHPFTRLLAVVVP